MALKSIDQGLAVRVLSMGTETTAFDTKANELDVQGFNGVCILLAHDGVAAASYKVQLVHSDDGTTWENASVMDVVSSEYTDIDGVATCPAGTDNIKVGYIGTKRYVAAEVTPASATGVVSVLGVLGAPDLFPTK